MKTPQEIMKIRELDRDLAQFQYELHSRSAYEIKPYSPADQNRMQRQLNQLRLRVSALTEQDELTAFFRAHFSDCLDSAQLDLEQANAQPSMLLNEMRQHLNNTLQRDTRRTSLRYMLMTNRWSALETALQAWTDRKDDLRDEALRQALSAVSSLMTAAAKAKTQIDSKTAEGADLLQQLTQAEAPLAAFQHQLLQLQDKRKLQPVCEQRSREDRLNTDPQEYRRILNMRMGVNLDELLDWHEEQIEKTRRDVFGLASRLQRREVHTMNEVREILDLYAGACGSPEEMFQRGHDYLARVREVCAQTLWLPEGEICDLTGVPEELRDSFPWGGYMGGCPYERPLRGRMFLNETNYTAVSDGWIKVNTIHEAYFGHHMQFLRSISDPIPETMKHGPKADPIIEGTAHRSEQVFESIFAEDPYFPLFTAYRRHHTSVRIKADLILRYENGTIGEAVDLYRRELGFDEKTARGQVLAQEEMYGYFTCYCYGLRCIEQMERESGLDPVTMTQRLFEAGEVSIETLRRFLALSEESRYSLLHDYPSLLQFA